jgi:hypothetical protein
MQHGGHGVVVFPNSTTRKRLISIALSRNTFFDAFDVLTRASIARRAPSSAFQSEGVAKDFSSSLSHFSRRTDDDESAAWFSEQRLATERAAAALTAWWLLLRHFNTIGGKDAATVVAIPPELAIGCTLERRRRMGNICEFISAAPDVPSRLFCITDGRKEDRGGYRRNNSVMVIALLEVLSVFDAFLSASMTRSIAAENTIVAEFLTAQAGSL